jgi:hypothetical protein
MPQSEKLEYKTARLREIYRAKIGRIVFIHGRGSNFDYLARTRPEAGEPIGCIEGEIVKAAEEYVLIYDARRDWNRRAYYRDIIE